MLTLALQVTSLIASARTGLKPVAAPAHALLARPFVACSRVGALSMQEDSVKTGKCKWFDSSKGFGFIDVDGEDSDIFVHQSDIYAPGFRSLAEGEVLEFKVGTDPKTGKLKAKEVTGPDGSYVQGQPRDMGYDGY